MAVGRSKSLLFFLFLMFLFCAPKLLFGHEIGPDNDGPENLHELWRAWGFEPGTLIGLAVSALLYGSGVWRLWRAAGIGHGIARWEVWCFVGGWLTLFVALVSPLHPLGEVLFSAHMLQHEMLMLMAAPLLVLSRPMIAFLHALPANTARQLGRMSNWRSWKIGWGAITAPLVAWFIHAIVLWVWHAPILFQATLTSEWVHAAQHLCFLFSALLFWWAMIHGHRGVTNYGAAVLYLFTTAVHSGLLGLLLTFSHSVWYPAYSNTQAWGLSALEDQQLGGLIMWVPACTVYIIAALVMFAIWLRQSDQPWVARETAVVPMPAESPL